MVCGWCGFEELSFRLSLSLLLCCAAAGICAAAVRAAAASLPQPLSQPGHLQQAHRGPQPTAHSRELRTTHLLCAAVCRVLCCCCSLLSLRSALREGLRNGKGTENEKFCRGVVQLAVDCTVECHQFAGLQFVELCRLQIMGIQFAALVVEW